MPRYRRAFSTAKTKPGERAKCNRGNLRKRPAEYDNDGNCRHRDPGAFAIRRERLRHTPNRLRHNGDGDELKPVQKSFRHRAGERCRSEREGEQEQGRWRGEGEPCRQAAQKAVAAQDAERKSHLAGCRSR
jgi:hypothetical protein